MTKGAVESALPLDPARLPCHVAIIMDGNGRWAEKRGLNRLEGHWEGYRALKRVVYAADDIGLKFLTVYGFSSENWRRPSDEVDGLMALMLDAMRREIEELEEKGIRVRVSGRLEGLPEDLRREFQGAMMRTNEKDKLTFNLAINYGGRAEILDAARRIAAEAAEGKLDPGTLSEADFAARLYTPDIPDPDLLIRTAGEMRLSNFLLWQTAYAELYVTETCWPDFGKEELLAAIQAFQGRVRKFGGLA